MQWALVRSVRPEDLDAFRHLQAVEGYVELGMFQEAEEELRALDPAWFAFDRTLRLQLRVLAGLGQC